MLFINHRSFAGGVENEIGIVVSGFASEKPARCDRSCSDDVAPCKLCVLLNQRPFLGKGGRQHRMPDNFFAETEQVAFMTQNVPPGIDFSNDPLLQGRNRGGGWDYAA